MFGLSRSRLSATDILDGKLKKGVRSAEGFYTVASVGSSTLIDNIIGTAVGTSTKIFSQSTEQIGKWSSAAVARDGKCGTQYCSRAEARESIWRLCIRSQVCCRQGAESEHAVVDEEWRRQGWKSG